MRYTLKPFEPDLDKGFEGIPHLSHKTPLVRMIYLNLIIMYDFSSFMSEMRYTLKPFEPDLD
jgi:tryptophan synthase alpha subunit